MPHLVPKVVSSSKTGTIYYIRTFATTKSTITIDFILVVAKHLQKHCTDYKDRATEVPDFSQITECCYANRTTMGLLLWLLSACAFLSCHCVNGLNSVELPVLRMGEERKRESLAFFDGSSCEYEVQGLQARKWYEIKISYPASIPASIDIRFHQHGPDYRRRAGRRLLDTEKTMFYVTEDVSQQQVKGRATVEVHPAGVISKHLSSDHPFIIYNILCEEVVLGIPKQALWVGTLAVLVVFFAFYISSKLPATLAPSNSRGFKDLKGAE